MKLAISLATLTTILLANGANPDTIKPIKDFTPPPPYTPNIAQSAFPENQFDLTPRDDYFFVTDLLDDSMDKFHISGGFYGKTFYSSELFKYRGANFYTILNTNFSKGNRYKDGGGKEYDYGYSRQGQSAIVGFVPNDMSEFRFTFLHDNIDDDKQPQHVMDSFKTQRYIGKFNARIGAEDLSNTLNFELMLRDINRIADNYHLRNSVSMAKVELDRKIFDAELKYDADFSSFHNLAGVKFSKDSQTGKRYVKTPNGWQMNGYRFAGVDVKNIRFFDTLSYKFNEFNKLSLALNFDKNSASLDKASSSYFVPGNLAAMRNNINSAKNLIKSIYAKELNGDITHNSFSGSLRYDFAPNEFDNYYLAIESIKRIGNNMERFNSLYGAGNDGWVSNPFLKPERHNRLNLGFMYKSEFYKEYMSSKQNRDSFKIGAEFIADEVDDLIIYDRRHLPYANVDKKNIMLRNAVITRNVDARIYSANLKTDYNFAKNFGVKAAFYYTYGQNKTDGRPLYQIRPFEANLALDYKDYASFGSFNLGTAMRYVAKQNRGDFDEEKGFGIDKKYAKAFSTMDIYGGFEFKNSWGVRLGVANLFDKDYAEFLSANHVAALSPKEVHAPGRTFFMSFHSSF
ncbi:MAG: TonB-dependent receptor domain-containing protein [Campylobacter sp.]